jgi:hypothetical protein
VGLDSARADEELRCNPAVGFAGGYELKHLELPLLRDSGSPAAAAPDASFRSRPGAC